MTVKRVGNRRLGDHGLGHRRGRGEGRLRGGAAQPGRRTTADAMVAGLEKSLAKQVERGKLDDAERDARPRPGARRHRPRRARRLRPRARVDRRGPRRSKKQLFSELDRICSDGAILATNTSTLPVVEMAMETGRPEQVCGIHFFNPAPMMAAGRGRPARSRRPTRPSQRRERSPRRAARTRSRCATRPASSSTRCCSRT